MVAWCNRLVGPLLGWALHSLLVWTTSLPDGAARTAGIAAWMAWWWMSEALPLPVTALLPLVLFPMLDVLDLTSTAAGYANRYIFLFMAGFMMARALEKWQLHRRMALWTVVWAGSEPQRLVGGCMLATAGLSMWISNTAAAVIMLPIGTSLIWLLHPHTSQRTTDQQDRISNLAPSLMLGIAYAASLGGLATLVGTPTNLLLAGFAEEHEIPLSFGRWLLFAGPLALFLLVAAWWLLTRWLYPLNEAALPAAAAMMRSQLREMGPLSPAEWKVLAVFTATATCWILREPLTQWPWLISRVPALERVDDTIVGLVGTFALFLLPVDFRRGQTALDWETAASIPWGLLLLFGGGFSLARAIADSGLAAWIGSLAEQLSWSPFPLMALITAVVILMTELTSNTPTAATLLPILHGVADGMGLSPMQLLAPATLAASCAFMLPVATPPNAIVFGSGYLRIADMVWAGVWLNLICLVAITGWSWYLGPWLLTPP